MGQENFQPFDLSYSVLCSLAPQARLAFSSLELLGIKQAELAAYFIKMSSPIHETSILALLDRRKLTPFYLMQSSWDVLYSHVTCLWKYKMDGIVMWLYI